MSIRDKHNALVNAFWNYNAEYVNHNGYRTEKEITPKIINKLNKLEEAIKDIKE